MVQIFLLVRSQNFSSSIVNLYIISFFQSQRELSSMSGSRSSSMSSLVVADQSKAKLSDFNSKWQENLKKGWKTLKGQVRMFKIR